MSLHLPLGRDVSRVMTYHQQSLGNERGLPTAGPQSSAPSSLTENGLACRVRQLSLGNERGQPTAGPQSSEPSSLAENGLAGRVRPGQSRVFQRIGCLRATLPLASLHRQSRVFHRRDRLPTIASLEPLQNSSCAVNEGVDAMCDGDLFKFLFSKGEIIGDFSFDFTCSKGEIMADFFF